MKIKTHHFIILITGFLAFATRHTTAQSDPQFSTYMFSNQLQNPASVGSTDMANAFMNYRHQWQNVGPQTIGAYFDMPIKIKDHTHGVAVAVLRDELGLFKNTNVNFSYARKQNLWNGVLSVGAQLGALNYVFDGNGVSFPDTEYHNSFSSITFESESSGVKFDLNLGFHYSTRNQHYGIALTHINRPVLELNYTGTSTYYNRTLIMYGGYDFKLKAIPTLKLKTNALLKSDGKITQIDLNCNAWYKDNLFAGMGYRFQDAIIFMGGFRLENDILIGAAYDITTSRMAFKGFGTAEVFLNYKFSLSLESKRNKYKSIRIL